MDDDDRIDFDALTAGLALAPVDAGDRASERPGATPASRLADDGAGEGIVVARAAARATSTQGGARLLGPGWFDSSFELRSGLVVREGWPSDVALETWIERFLAAPRESA